MKSPSRLRRLAAGLLLTAALPSLTACSLPLTAPPDSTAAENRPADSTEENLRAYYEALIAELKQDLLDAKQNDYLLRAEYESRIAELEAKLNATEAPPAGSDIPVSGDPDPLPPSETASADTTPTIPTTAFHYIIEGDSVAICIYQGAARAVTIPASIAGFPVTRIADNAFRATSVTAVTIPPSVTEIGWFAFADCPTLAVVSLPTTVTVIEYGAFDNCPNLTVYCPKDSYAAEYAASFALRVVYVKE